MPLSWNEIKDLAIKFSRDHADDARERGEAQSFWNDFFSVFGIQRRLVATFEKPVKKLSGSMGAIDLFWEGVLLAEHKSKGEDLSKAKAQAFKYIRALAAEGKQKEIPKYVIVSDFERIALHDLEPEDTAGLPLFDQFPVRTLEFKLEDFHKHVHDFAFIPGYKQHKFADQDPINIEAVEIMGDLHDALEAGGYKGHDLERFLVRILFCLFADNTGLFERQAFHLYIVNSTKEDGSDLGPHLARLFEVLDTPVGDRQKKLDETLAAFPYVNGDLYKERLRFADFDRAMRDALLEATKFDWSRISPAVFGALFQSVMETAERRKIGAHYTSERDILKVARGLFLDDLREEYAGIVTDKSTRKIERLKSFHEKISSLKFFDPACGCGNFLVITYREMRQLEIDLLVELHGKSQQVLDIHQLSQIDVDAFYGIEIEEWPSRIAEVAMWLMDHQMNIKLSQAFGQYYHRLPLKKSPTIVNVNAITTDWETVIPSQKCSFILGNPPFVGKTYMTEAQKADMQSVCGQLKAYGLLDYVCAWYFKAAKYIKGTKIKVGFVSTNSITQGEQVGLLWNELFSKFHTKIIFAHRTFPWSSEARGKAHVHVVIIGFAAFDGTNKHIYDYQHGESNVTVSTATNINPYLVEGTDLVVLSRTTPISNFPAIVNGSKQVDGGFLTLNREEKDHLIKTYPQCSPYVRPFIGSEEFINGQERWCLWLVAAPPELIRSCEEIRTRVENVKNFRLSSKKKKTQESATTPYRFGEVRNITSDYLAIPEVSSEKRRYVPIGFLPKTTVPSNKIQVVPEATLFHFGILCSEMHMAWMRQVAGRLESRYSYSAKIVYNNFPWPEEPSKDKKAKVESCAQAVLDARQLFLDSGQSLADLYDPLTMPEALQKAHQALNKAVEKCYRPESFASDQQRVEYLFQRYQALTAPLLPTPKKGRRRK